MNLGRVLITVVVIEEVIALLQVMDVARPVEGVKLDAIRPDD